MLRCGAGFYSDAERVCHPCHSSCKTCTGPRASDCSSCEWNQCARSACPPGILPLLEGRSYVSRCPEGSFPSGASCRRCSPTCRECRGPTDRHCIDPTPTTPFGDSDCRGGSRRMGGRCVLPCGYGQFAVPNSTECQQCTNFDCEFCDPVAGDTCLSCKPDWSEMAAQSNPVTVPVAVLCQSDLPAALAILHVSTLRTSPPHDSCACTLSHPLLLELLLHFRSSPESRHLGQRQSVTRSRHLRCGLSGTDVPFAHPRHLRRLRQLMRAM